MNILSNLQEMSNVFWTPVRECVQTLWKGPPFWR
jgi:hypothetical protein